MGSVACSKRLTTGAQKSRNVSRVTRMPLGSASLNWRMIAKRSRHLVGGERLEPGDVEEGELLRQGEVLLQEAEARVHRLGVGDERLALGEADELERLERERGDGGVAPGGVDRGERQPLDVGADPEAEVVLQAALAVDVEAELREVDRRQRGAARHLELDAQRLRELGAGVDAHVLDRERQELDVLGGAEAAGDAVDGHRADLGVAGDGELLAHHVGQGGELDDARRRDLPQVVGEEQRGDRVDDLGQLVVELLPDLAGEEGDALEQALDVRVPALGQHGRDRRVRRGELAPELAQVRQLVLVVLVEHTSRRQSTRPGGRCQPLALLLHLDVAAAVDRRGEAQRLPAPVGELELGGDLER